MTTPTPAPTGPMNPDQRALRTLAGDPSLAPLPMLGSPMAEALGTRLVKADPQALTVEVAFDPGLVFTQAAGVLQGGAVAAMLDFVLAYAALQAVPDGQSVASATLNVAFLRAGRPGPLRGLGRVERAGRTLVFTAAELQDAAGQPIATGSSALPVVPWRG